MSNKLDQLIKLEKASGQVRAFDIQIRNILNETVEQLNGILEGIKMADNKAVESNDETTLQITRLNKQIENLVSLQKQELLQEKDLKEIKKAIKEIKLVVPDKVEVKNLSDIIIPAEFAIKEANWLNKNFEKLVSEMREVKQALPDRIRISNQEPRDYIPVRLVGMDRKFYDAKFMGGGGGHGSAPTKVKIWDGTNVREIVNDATDLNNSTEDLLTAGQTFTGTATPLKGYSTIAILVHSDVASATKGLEVDFSPDGIDWHAGEAYTVPADTVKFFTPPAQAEYYRIRYTNGGSNQSTFHLHALLKVNPIKWSSHNLQDNLNDEDDGILTVSVLKLRTAQNTYVSGSATNAGNFKMSLEEYNGLIKSIGLPITWGEGANDSFGRGRVSEPNNRFDVEFIYDKQPDLVDEVTNNGTVTHNSNSRDLTLSLASANNGDKAEVYSHYDVPYTAGNSQLVDVTGTLDNAGLGGGVAQLFVRTKISGSVVETVVDQTSWDAPVADVDWTKSQIFMFDFQSLKVGRIRYFLNRNGVAVKVHEIHNDNVRATGYWQRPTLPLAWRLYCDATYTYMEIGYGDDENAIGFRYRMTANANATMRAICGTVKSEGGMELFGMDGFNRSIDMGITAKTVSTTLIPIISIRPRATFNSLTNRGLYIPDGWVAQTNNPVRLAVIYKPTLTGASWANVDANNSGIEYDITASAITGGEVVDFEYLATGSVNSRTKDEGLLGRTILALGRTGTPDILTIAMVRSGSVNASVLAGLKWREIR